MAYSKPQLKSNGQKHLLVPDHSDCKIHRQMLIYANLTVGFN